MSGRNPPASTAASPRRRSSSDASSGDRHGPAELAEGTGVRRRGSVTVTEVGMSPCREAARAEAFAVPAPALAPIESALRRPSAALFDSGDNLSPRTGTRGFLLGPPPPRLRSRLSPSGESSDGAPEAAASGAAPPSESLPQTRPAPPRPDANLPLWPPPPVGKASPRSAPHPEPTVWAPRLPPYWPLSRCTGHDTSTTSLRKLLAKLCDVLSRASIEWELVVDGRCRVRCT